MVGDGGGGEAAIGKPTCWEEGAVGLYNGCWEYCACMFIARNWSPCMSVVEREPENVMLDQHEDDEERRMRHTRGRAGVHNGIRVHLLRIGHAVLWLLMLGLFWWIKRIRVMDKVLAWIVMNRLLVVLLIHSLSWRVVTRTNVYTIR
jgi:hypothetical protein